MKKIKLRKIQIAKKYFDRLMGLMGRTTWPSAYQGLYFPNCRSVHTFFTFLWPDLLFLDKNNKILRIVPSAKPWLVFLGPTPTYGCLELPQGASRHWGLKVGKIIDWSIQ